MNSAATSLDHLHDLVLPPPAPWWPPTWGWMLVSAAVLAILLTGLVKRIIHWQANRYRREALLLLESTPPEQLSALAKRVALSVWPREQVAHLTGQPWLEFLDRTAGMTAFVNGPGNPLEHIAFAPDAEKHSRDVHASVREWIHRHRREVKQ